MQEIQSIVEDTRAILPPNISDLLNPNPVGYAPIPFANLQSALNNATFQLYTSGTVPVNINKVMSLHQNTTANNAIITIEAAPGANKDDVLARFWMDGSHPSNTNGLPLKHMGVFEVVGRTNVQNFRIISADDFPHTIQVQYLQ